MIAGVLLHGVRYAEADKGQWDKRLSPKDWFRTADLSLLHQSWRAMLFYLEDIIRQLVGNAVLAGIANIDLQKNLVTSPHVLSN